MMTEKELEKKAEELGLRRCSELMITVINKGMDALRADPEASDEEKELAQYLSNTIVEEFRSDEYNDEEG